jgi:copper chaperone CopZ
MKLTILKPLLTAAFLVFCLVTTQAQDKVETVEVKVTGMMCGGCASKVHKVLNETAGIIDNEVKYPGDVAVVKYNPEKTNPKEIVGVIEEKTDFSAELKEES